MVASLHIRAPTAAPERCDMGDGDGKSGGSSWSGALNALIQCGNLQDVEAPDPVPPPADDWCVPAKGEPVEASFDEASYLSAKGGAVGADGVGEEDARLALGHRRDAFLEAAHPAVRRQIARGRAGRLGGSAETRAGAW